MLLWVASLFVVFVMLLSGCQMTPEAESSLLAMSRSDIELLSPSARSRHTATAQQSINKRYYAQFFSRTEQAPTLQVSVSGGTAAMAPTYAAGAYHATVVQVPANQCTSANLRSVEHQGQSATLSLCYLNDKLYVDASSIDANYPLGSFIIPISNRFVSQQRFCQMRTKGNAKLSGACMLIAQQGDKQNHDRPVQLVNRAEKNPSFEATLRGVDNAPTLKQPTQLTSSVEDAANRTA